MTRIFQLVLDDQPCYYDNSENDDNYNNSLPPKTSLKYPEILSHVCSRWRQIALGSHILWSHIDIFAFRSHSKFKRLLLRGEAFASRANHSPTHVHISGRGTRRRRSHNANVDLNAFCASVATRIAALELVVPDWHDYGYFSILKNCLAGCVAGTLNRLVVMGRSDATYHGFGFIEGAEQLADPGSKRIDVSKQHLEDLLFPVKVLRLSDLYLPWTSKAYHGLVDLQLTCQSSPPQISQLQLESILAASPKLRLFRFGLRITDPVAGGSLGSPTLLNDLELLSLGPLSYSQHKALLPIISPGSKQLRMSINLDGERLPLLPSDEFVKFMTHSNVTHLSIKHDGRIALRWLPQLLLVTPSLKTLSLTGVDLCSNHVHPLDFHPSKVEFNKLRPVGSRLDCLKLVDCRVTKDEFRRTTEIFPIQKLELKDCSPHSMYLFKFDLNDLAETFPIFEFIDGPMSTNSNYRAPWDELY